MNLSNRSIGLVIGLATIALVGLTVIQLRSLNSSIKTNREIFRQKLDLSSGISVKNFLEIRVIPQRYMVPHES